MCPRVACMRVSDDSCAQSDRSMYVWSAYNTWWKVIDKLGRAELVAVWS